MRCILIAFCAFIAGAEDIELCSKGLGLVPQSWGPKKVDLHLSNWVGKPLLVKVFAPGKASPEVYNIPGYGGGSPDRGLRAKAGSVLRIWIDGVKPKALYERMVVPHDGSMGTSGIYPCGQVPVAEFKALVVDTPCDESVPTKFWNCVRPAPPIETWPKEKYGFSPEEIAKTPADARTYGPYTTEANTEWNAEPYTQPGYVMLKMPDDVYAALKNAYKQHKQSQVEGDVAGHYSNFHGQVDKGNAWRMVNLDNFQKERAIVSGGVKRLLTAWSKRQLQHEATYGIRVYHENAVLINHRDVPTTHFISAVLMVNQTVNEGWPLLVETQRDPVKYAEIYLQPGYMAFYEGVRLKHGRPMRFNGTEFAMAFTHNRPIDFYPETTYRAPKKKLQEPDKADL